MIGKIILLISVVIIGIIFGGYEYYVSYQYDKQIGAYMENAIDMVAPEGMLEQMQSSKQGMIDSGLTDNDYGALIFKKPDNSMKFQYQHIDGIIERINAVVDWKNKMYGNESQNAETLGDVYEQKMTNLRQYIKGETMEGSYGTRSDWIAKDSWYIKNHIIIYLSWIFWIVWSSVGVIMVLLIFVEADH